MPNHHFAAHVPPQLEDYGTAYELWTYLCERLNKVLKSTNMNNRRGGQQECTMMRHFLRDTQIAQLVSNCAVVPTRSVQIADAKIMVGSQVVQSGFRTVIDSGTTLIYPPPSQVAAFYKAIPGAQVYDQSRGFYTFPCS